MDFPKAFSHREAEERWYSYWQNHGFFHSEPDERPAYTIVMPPPNVTGVLHMGHALNNTVQDILIRNAKSRGFNTCWVPGTDHASIATEAKVVGALRDQGIDKATLSREDFLKHAWEWKEKYGGIILEQLKKLGCALDWDRTAFTMDPDYYKAVIRVFVDLYKKGLIYRGVKMINWDPRAKTALSDEEVLHKQTASKLVYVKYPIEGSEGEFITVATVRAETIPGDTAVCVHPEDPRYAHLKGKYCIVPLVNRRVPIIFDDYIDIEFGTGALKVTPAHDINDYNLGLKYNLPVVDTLTAEGTMSEAAQVFVGEDRFVARKKIIALLKEQGFVEKEEDYSSPVGYSERTNAVVEPRLSMQWWCKMDELAKPALDAVVNDEVSFVPPKFKNLYRHWMENIKDWCVSRQLWWGQRIPAWYDVEGNIYVAETEEEARAQCKANNSALDLARQDEDVLDTWFSSWLWPMQVFGWNDAPDNKELAYYYPTATLVTAPEIIFFWVARMIMAGYHFKGQKPFDKVYFTGIVRDKQGRKMSKSLGNSPDLLQLIEDNGADAIRFSVMISSPAGNDLLFDEGQIDQGRAFINKMWNALKLVKSWEARISPDVDASKSDFALSWMQERIAQASLEVDGLLEDFRLSEALKTIYSLIWDDFCSWYLEWIKPSQTEGISASVWNATADSLESLLGLLHPFLPFVTEELYHLLRDRADGDCLMVRQRPQLQQARAEVLSEGAFLQTLITAVRDTRNKTGHKPKETVALSVTTGNKAFYERHRELVQRNVMAHDLQFVDSPVPGAHAFVAGVDKLYLQSENSNAGSEQAGQAMQKELDHLRGFLLSVEKKLSNERFVQNAQPSVVEAERKKQSDALAKIQTLEESLRLL
jgi:valyl-tRNA synthetase